MDVLHNINFALQDSKVSITMLLKQLSGSCLQVRTTENPEIVLRKCLNWTKSWQKLSSFSVIATRNSQFENVYAIILFWASEGLQKCLRKTVHKQDKQETKKKRRIVQFVYWKMPKLAHILKSGGNFVVFLFCSCIKRICQVKM